MLKSPIGDVCSKILLLLSGKKGAIPIPTLQLKSSTFICLASFNSRIGLFPQRELLRQSALYSNPLCKLICLLMLKRFFPLLPGILHCFIYKEPLLMMNVSISHHFLALSIFFVYISVKILSMPFYSSVIHV